MKIFATWPLTGSVNCGCGFIVAPEDVCESCGKAHSADNVLRAIKGDHDSFGYEVIVLCHTCLHEGDEEASKAREERIAAKVAELGGEQDITFRVSVIANRDTANDFRFVRGTRSAVIAFIHIEERIHDKGDYVYAHTLRPKQPGDQVAYDDWD